MKVKLIVKTKHEQLEKNDLFLRMKNVGSTDSLFELSGPKFTSKIILRTDLIPGKPVSISIQLNLLNKNSADVFDTITILEGMSSENAISEIQTENGKKLMELGSPVRKDQIPFGQIQKISEKLTKLGNELGVGFKFPQYFDEANINSLMHLHNVFVIGESPSYEGELAWPLRIDVTEETVALWRQGKVPFVLQWSEREAILFGTKFIVPKHSATLTTYQLLFPTTPGPLKAGTEIKVSYNGMKFEVPNK